MVGHSKDNLESLLLKLCNIQIDDESANKIILDIADSLSNPLQTTEFGTCLSIIFGKGGLIEFCRRIAKDFHFLDAKKNSLELFELLLKKDVNKLSKYTVDLHNVSKYLYNVDKASKVRCSALSLLGSLLMSNVHYLDIQTTDIHYFIEQICLNMKKSSGSLLLSSQLKFLGILAYTIPEKLGSNHNLIFKVLRDNLIKQCGLKCDPSIASGAVRGLSFYLQNFPQGEDDCEKFYSELFQYLHKLMDPATKMAKRDAQRAVMELLSKHGPKFSDDLWNKCDEVFGRLSKWCQSTNRDDHKAAVPAMDTFITVIANLLELRDKDSDSQRVFRFFLREYNALLDNSNSSSELSLAIKGYGLMSGACRLYLSPHDVHIMFNRVLTISQQSFFHSSEMLENKLDNLPSYVESLGIIFGKMESLSTSNLESLMQLTLALCENFPRIASSKQFLAFRAIFTLLAAVIEKPIISRQFLHNFVFQSMILSCCHPTLLENTNSDDFTNNSESNWTGLKEESFTYKHYLPFWRALLGNSVIASVKIVGKPTALLKDITEKMYCEFLVCVMDVVENLDLTISKVQDSKEEDTDSSTDLLTGLELKVPKDFQLYANLASLLEELLPLQDKSLLVEYIAHHLFFFIRRSSLEPYVSMHYNIITALLISCRKNEFFEKDEVSPNLSSTIDLLTSYSLEVLQRCKQYRDLLLASCLTLIFNLPISIVEDIFPHLVSPLKMSLRMGLSYLPIAQVCTTALTNWSTQLPSETLYKYYPEFLPMFLPYLRSQEYFAGEMQTRVINMKMSLGRQKRKIDQKKMKEVRKIDSSEMEKLQLVILKFLGQLNQDLCSYVIPKESEAYSESAIAWDTENHVQFSIPYQGVKIDIFLDNFLPRIVDLAINSSHRQTKVAACELLHSVIIIMIGIGAQQSESIQLSHPKAPLYRHLFKAMLKLSCDTDHVLRQLFPTLTYQTIHWFTNNRSYENPDTAMLLQSIMDLLIVPHDNALRDFGAQCLKEFFIWSRKQARDKNQLLINTKSIIKRIIINCQHPSAFKRLGGCLAWNSIYQEFREDEDACNVWLLAILDALILCLKFSEDDDNFIGTQMHCKMAIKHVQRILIGRANIFNKTHKLRRVPDAFGNGTLRDVVQSLFSEISSEKSLLRHSMMEFLDAIIPMVKGCSSTSEFFIEHIKIEGFSHMINIFENGLKEYCIFEALESDFLFKHLSMYYKGLLSSLECYVWLISKRILHANQLVEQNSIQILSAIEKFIDTFALYTTEKFLESDILFRGGSITMTATQCQKLNELKCSVIIRLFDFIIEFVNNDKSSAKQLENKFFKTSKMFEIILNCSFNPSDLGFNLNDTEIKKHLPSRMICLFKVLRTKMSKELYSQFALFIEEYIKKHYDLTLILNEGVRRGGDIPLKSYRSLDGFKVLENTGWFTDVSSKISMANDIFDWILKLHFVQVEERTVLQQLDPKDTHFAIDCLKLSIALVNSNKERLLSLLFCNEKIKDNDGRPITKGNHIFNSLGEGILPIFLDDPDLYFHVSGELAQNGNFVVAVEFILRVLRLLQKNSELRSRFSSPLIKSFLNHWTTFQMASGSSVTKQEQLVSLFLPLFLIDQKGNILASLKSSLSDEGHSILSFYKEFLKNNFVDLKSKMRALKILPFFLMDERHSEQLVQEALEAFRVDHLPLRSTEFEFGSRREREYFNIITDFLTALELSGNLPFLKFLSNLFCVEKTHRYDSYLADCMSKLMESSKTAKQLNILKFLYSEFKSLSSDLRLHLMEKIMIPCLQFCGAVPILHFYIENVRGIMDDAGLFISGQPDEQKEILINKIGAFLLLQILYSKLPKAKVFTPGAEIPSAFNTSDATGKELTKEIFKRALRAAKGEMRQDAPHVELRRLCACAAYNTLIAALSNVQDQLKFYTNFLFAESTKENLFGSILDLQQKFEFDIELNVNPSKKSQFVTIFQGNPSYKDVGEPATSKGIKYVTGDFLSDSSLKDHVSQFDFSSAVVLTQNLPDAYDERVSASEKEMIGLTSLKLDRYDFNNHEVMPNLVAVAEHMVKNRIMPNFEGGSTATLSDLPQWMTFLKSKLETNQPKNIKLFILRFIINTESVFLPYANLFILPILECVNDGILGCDINYFVTEVLVTVVNWGRKVPLDNDSNKKRIISDTFSFLVSNVPNTRADIFKYNLTIVEAVVKIWKEDLIVKGEKIIQLLEIQEGEMRECEAGLQIAGILLFNGVNFLMKEDTILKSRFESLLLSLLSDKRAAMHNAAAETLGLFLSLTNDSTLLDKVMRTVLPMSEDRSLSCVFHIQKRYKDILPKYINRLLTILPHLYGIYRERAFECLTCYSVQMENLFLHLKEQNIRDCLSRKESKIQLSSLELINKVLPRLTAEEIEYFVSDISSFSNHAETLCRAVMYEIFVWIHDNYSHFDGGSIEKRISDEACLRLLKGVKDDDSALRLSMLNYWIKQTQNLTLPEKLLFIFQRIYNADAEDIFLLLSSHILLEGTRCTADFTRPIFNHPLTECIFQEFKVQTQWQNRHSSMFPFFIESQLQTKDSSIGSLIAMTQGNVIVDGRHSIKGVQATQPNQPLFSSTQKPESVMKDTFNWVTGSTLDTSLAEESFQAASLYPQSTSSGLLFTGDMSRFKRPGLGKSTGKEINPKTSSKETIEAGLIKRRFYANQNKEKQTVYYAQREERRQKQRHKIEYDRKLKREAQVDMFRAYRVGELPDVQIPYKDVITPLQAVAERDESIASELFCLMADSILKEASHSMPEEELKTWRDDVFEAVKSIFKKSVACHSLLMKSLLNFALSNDIHLDPEAVSVVCMSANLESLGIMTLERQLIPLACTSDPPSKKRKGPSEHTLNEEKKLTIWLCIADLYKNLEMWDFVSGILKSEIGSLKLETVASLEAESVGNHFESYKNYLQALQNEDYVQNTSKVEQKVWEEWFIKSAATLGQWDEVEKFAENRVLSVASKLTAVWDMPQALSLSSALVNSKLMKIFNGSSDGNLCEFIDESRTNPNARSLLEENLPLQLAMVALNQEKFEESAYFLKSAQKSILSQFVSTSLLTKKLLSRNLNLLKPLNELQNFLSCFGNVFDKQGATTLINSYNLGEITHSCTVDDQFLISVRSLYLHFIEKEYEKLSYNCCIIDKARASNHIILAKSAISALNPHLAHRHLMKLEKLAKGTSLETEYYYLKANASILRAKQKDPDGKIRYLVEAWCKYLGQINQSLNKEYQCSLESKYLTLESELCLYICKAIMGMEEYDSQNTYIRILADKFPNIDSNDKSSWYKGLLECSFLGLKKAVLMKEANDTDCQIKACLTLASFCDECMDTWKDFTDAKVYSGAFVSSVLNSMSLGSKEGRSLFPRLIYLLDQDPNLLELFNEGIESVPLWMFILWISHIMIYIDKNPGPGLHGIVEKLAAQYPQAVIYPFEVSKSSFNYSGVGAKAREVCGRISNTLQKHPLLYDFVIAISKVRVPQIELKDHLKRLHSTTQMKDIQDGLKSFRELISRKITTKELASACGDSYSFATVKKVFEEKFGCGNKDIQKVSLKKIKDDISSIENAIKVNIPKLSNKLESYSPWLANFQSTKFKDFIEIPGQYTGLTKPLPEYHVKISGFSRTVRILPSLRAPIRLSIYGSDESEYSFLVKAGEDLRTDQRMEIMFTLMNDIYSSSANCKRLTHRPYLTTYQVLPLSLQVGLLQWVSNTQPLMNFIEDTLDDAEKLSLNRISQKYYTSEHYSFQKVFVKRTKCIETYESLVNLLPLDIIKRGLLKLSSNAEGFFYLRSEFASSYATMCISHWVLGIGDRHLSNTLIDLKTARPVGIDFGHHFESATQVLPIPELMPFRLTPQIYNTFYPLCCEGPVRETMIGCLSALTESRLIIYAAVEAFIKEPTEDWVSFITKQTGGSDNPLKLKELSQEKMKYLRSKLCGANPTSVTNWALSKNKHVSRCVNQFIEVVTGDKSSKRAQLPKGNLSVCEQVKCLIELATDPNILGRTYFGWKPFL